MDEWMMGGVVCVCVVGGGEREDDGKGGERGSGWSEQTGVQSFDHTDGERAVFFHDVAHHVCGQMLRQFYVVA